MHPNDTTEEWRDVIGYEGLYQVSNLGRVRSLDRVTPHNYPGYTRKRPGRILKAHLANHGYYKVVLCSDAEQISRSIHSLVAEAFLGPRPEGCTIHHKDRDRTHNQPDNLEYIIAEHHGRLHSHGELVNTAKLTREQVREIRVLLAQGTTGASLARQYGVSRTLISQIRSGKSWAWLND